jgi:hypothetical protein
MSSPSYVVSSSARSNCFRSPVPDAFSYSRMHVGHCQRVLPPSPLTLAIADGLSGALLQAANLAQGPSAGSPFKLSLPSSRFERYIAPGWNISPRLEVDERSAVFFCEADHAVSNFRLHPSAAVWFSRFLQTVFPNETRFRHAA